jgi:hypothetical protein
LRFAWPSRRHAGSPGALDSRGPIPDRRHLHGDSEHGQPWRTGSATAPTDKPDADGAEELFEPLLDDSPQAYARFAREYLEISPSEAAVEAVYQSQPLDPTILAELNPDAPYEDVRQQVDAMGLFAP